MAAEPCYLLFAGLFTSTVLGYTPDYEYLDEHCGETNGPLQFSKDFVLEYSRLRTTVPAQYRCQVSVQNRISTRQVQVRFRYLNTVLSPNCAVVGLKLSEGATPLTPKQGVCGDRKPSVNYRTAGNTVTVQLTNTADDSYAQFELLFTSFYFSISNYSCWNDDFRCNNGICVSDDLTCNGYNDCGDDSDETDICSLNTGVIVGIVIGTVIFVVMCTGFGFCLRRRRRSYLRMAEETHDILVDHLHTLTARCDMLELEQELLKKKVHKLERCSDREDSHARRRNLLFFGIPRTVTETPEVCEAKVRRTIRSDMMVAAEVFIERVRRLSNAVVVVEFLSLRDKRLVLSHARYLPTISQVRIAEDFSPRIREIRKGLEDMKQKYIASGRRAVLRHDKLYTEFDVFTFDLRTRTVRKVGRGGGGGGGGEGGVQRSSGHAQYMSLNKQRLSARPLPDTSSLCDLDDSDID